MAKNVLHIPAGKAPPGGWPVLVGLHGHGSKPSDFAPLAQFAAARGMVGLMLPGPEVLFAERYAWSKRDIADTHTYVQKSLAALRTEKGVALGPIYVLGFSQGALHAVLLAMNYPLHYSGTVAISPGGYLEVPSALVGRAPRPLFMIYGKKESQYNIELAREIVTTFKKAGHPVREFVHSGRHHFPDGWQSVLKQGLTFLRMRSASPVAASRMNSATRSASP